MRPERRSHTASEPRRREWVQGCRYHGSRTLTEHYRDCALFFLAVPFPCQAACGNVLISIPVDKATSIPPHNALGGDACDCHLSLPVVERAWVSVVREPVGTAVQIRSAMARAHNRPRRLTRSPAFTARRLPRNCATEECASAILQWCLPFQKQVHVHGLLMVDGVAFNFFAAGTWF